MNNATTLRNGTLSGTLLGILPSLPEAELLKTMILAAIGAFVSFAVTLVLRSLFKKPKK